MIDGEIKRAIEQEVRKQVNIILSGQAGQNDQFNETINNLFPGMPGIVDRPVMHPYGLSSRAPLNTISVTARTGDHAGNRMTLGHRDANRPTVGSGEVQLYNQFGQAIFLKNGSVHLGTATTSNPAVVGNELKAFLQEVIQWLSTHTHIGNLGAPTSGPIQASQITSIGSSNVDNDKILSQLVFLEKGG